MTHTELAERIEREGASRELDAEIAVSILGMERSANLFDSADETYVLERDYYDLEGGPRELPAYTSSLDAAMSLVPEGWRAAFEQGAWNDQDPSKTEAWVWPFESGYDPDWQLGQETQHSNPDCKFGYAPTPAAALCAAALRAGDKSHG